jgi:hypothetical protein
LVLRLTSLLVISRKGRVENEVKKCLHF